MIKEGSKVSLHYTLTVNGVELESSQGKTPLTYVHGDGIIIPGLEEALDGMDTGDKKDIKVTPEKGYGKRDPDALQKVPKSAFEKPEGMKIGDRVLGNAGGQDFEATITAIDDEGITLDLNHPLAGKTLDFSVEILEIL